MGSAPACDDVMAHGALQKGGRVALDVTVVTGEAATVVSVQRSHRPEGLSSPCVRRSIVHVVVDAGRARALKVPHAMVVSMVLLFVRHLDDTGQSKVGDSQRERDGVDQNIGGLDVPVHNSAAVKVTHCPHQLLHQAAHNFSIEMRPHGRAPLGQVDAAVLEHDVENMEGVGVGGGSVGVGLGFDDVDDFDDVRVIQPPQNGNFAEDAHGILRSLENVSDSLDYNGRVVVVSVRAPAHLAIRAAPHPLVQSESARHVPHSVLSSTRNFVDSSRCIRCSDRRHCRALPCRLLMQALLFSASGAPAPAIRAATRPSAAQGTV